VLRVALRGLLAHKVRLAATAIAVFLGVAFMAGTQVLTATMSRSFDEVFADVYKNIDVVVRSNREIETGFGSERARIDEAAVVPVRAVPGVEAAEGQVQGSLRLIGRDDKPIGNADAGPPTFGLNWLTEPALNQWKLVAGNAPTGPGQLVLDKKTATDNGFSVGDHLKVAVQQGNPEFTVVGIATFGKIDNYGGVAAALFDTPTAQSLVGQPGTFDWINVAGAEGLSQTQLQSRVAAVLPPEDQAITGAAFTKESQDTFRQAIAVFNRFLTVFAGVALFVGAFIIYNTFSIIVAQRGRELALLRAVGASRRQVRTAVLAEAAIVGLVASVLGLLGGIGLAIGMRALLRAVGFALPTTPPVVEVSAIVASLLVGTLVTVVSAWFPARRASAIAPVEAMRDVAIDTSGRSKVRVAAGIVLTLAGSALLWVGLVVKGDNAVQKVGGGAFFVFLGIAVLGPSFAGPLSRLLGAPLARFRGITGRLAQGNAVRNPKRTAATASALMIGVGLMCLVAVAAASIKATAVDAIDSSVAADFIVNSQGFDGLPPSIATELATTPDVQAAAGLRFGPAEVGNSGQFVVGLDPRKITQILKIDILAGSLDDLDTDQIAVSKKVAEDKGYQVGSAVPIVFRSTGPQTFTVGAVYDSQLFRNGRAYLVSTDAFDANFATSEQTDRQVYVKLRPGVTPAAARAQIEQVTDRYPTAKLQDLTQFKSSQEAQVDQFVNFVYALLALSVIIATVGIVNTLLLSVYERTRELGLLRAVGMTRAQVRGSIQWESVIIAVLGTLLGVAIGVSFGWALVTSLASEGLKKFAVPVDQFIVIIVAAGLVGVLAALWPARRAARLDVLQAIATE